jgi:hypothetical protein
LRRRGSVTWRPPPGPMDGRYTVFMNRARQLLGGAQDGRVLYKRPRPGTQPDRRAVRRATRSRRFPPRPEEWQ